MRRYAHSFVLPAPRAAVFALFSDPLELDRLTPGWFRLVPREPLPERLVPGSEVAYRLRWRGLPLAWTSRITDWREPAFLAYEQARGPYRFFRHEHFFEPAAGGTAVRDVVTYRAPGGALAARLLLEPDLARIFACRERRARALLSGLQREAAATGISRMPRTSASSSTIERPT